MTNRERLKALLGFSAEEDSINGALLDAGVDGDVDYVPANILPIKKAAIEVLKILLSTADTGNGTVAGFGFTMKYDRNAILKRIADLSEELNQTDTSARIRAKHIW